MQVKLCDGSLFPDCSWLLESADIAFEVGAGSDNFDVFPTFFYLRPFGFSSYRPRTIVAGIRFLVEVDEIAASLPIGNRRPPRILQRLNHLSRG